MTNPVVDSQALDLAVAEALDCNWTDYMWGCYCACWHERNTPPHGRSGSGLIRRYSRLLGVDTCLQFLTDTGWKPSKYWPSWLPNPIQKE